MAGLDRRKHDFDVMEHVFEGVRASTASDEVRGHLATVEAHGGGLIGVDSHVDVDRLDSEPHDDARPGYERRRP